MPKNTGRGGRNYRRGPHKTQIKRELVLKEEGTVYGQVTKMLGSGRVEVYCFDCVKRLGNIRGKMKRRVWIGVGDVVLVSLREFQNEKCDIILKYTPEEVRQLKAQEEIPENIEVNENSDDIEFTAKGGDNDQDNSSDSDDESDSDDNSDDDVKEVPKKLDDKAIDDI